MTLLALSQQPSVYYLRGHVPADKGAGSGMPQRRGACRRAGLDRNLGLFYFLGSLLIIFLASILIVIEKQFI